MIGTAKKAVSVQQWLATARKPLVDPGARADMHLGFLVGGDGAIAEIPGVGLAVLGSHSGKCRIGGYPGHFSPGAMGASLI